MIRAILIIGLIALLSACDRQVDVHVPEESVTIELKASNIKCETTLINYQTVEATNCPKTNQVITGHPDENCIECADLVTTCEVIKE